MVVVVVVVVGSGEDGEVGETLRKARTRFDCGRVKTGIVISAQIRATHVYRRMPVRMIIPKRLH